MNSTLTKLRQDIRGNVDYKAGFHDAVTNILRHPIKDRQDRARLVDAVIDTYITEIGDVPDSYEVERMTNHLLREELTDSRPDKMSLEEYPIMSDYQLARRQYGAHKGKSPNSRIEVPLSSIGNIATDGRDYSYPKRRQRTIEEMIYMDEVTLSRNAERRAKYQEFKRGKSQGVFSVDIRTGKKTIHNETQYQQIFS